MSASTSTVTTTRIQTNAFGMEAAGETGRRSVCQHLRSRRCTLGDTPRGGSACGRVGEHDGSQTHHAPRQRVLEEPRVQERVDEERGTYGGEADSERALAARDEHERPPDGDEKPEVDREADDAELREHR